MLSFKVFNFFRPIIKARVKENLGEYFSRVYIRMRRQKKIKFENVSSAVNEEKDLSRGTIVHNVMLGYVWFQAFNFIIPKLIINIMFGFKYFSNFVVLKNII